MDLYSAEKLVLQRHNDLVEEGERLARLLDGTDLNGNGFLRVWTAGRLRALADRLDRTQRPAASSLWFPRARAAPRRSLR